MTCIANVFVCVIDTRMYIFVHILVLYCINRIWVFAIEKRYQPVSKIIKHVRKKPDGKKKETFSLSRKVIRNYTEWMLSPDVLLRSLKT